MSASVIVRLIGTVTGLIGGVGVLVSFQAGATLFWPFFAVLALTGIGVSLYGWGLRETAS